MKNTLIENLWGICTEGDLGKFDYKDLAPNSEFAWRKFEDRCQMKRCDALNLGYLCKRVVVTIEEENPEQ